MRPGGAAIAVALTVSDGFLDGLLVWSLTKRQRIPQLSAKFFCFLLLFRA